MENIGNDSTRRPTFAGSGNYQMKIVPEGMSNRHGSVPTVETDNYVSEDVSYCSFV